MLVFGVFLLFSTSFDLRSESVEKSGVFFWKKTVILKCLLKKVFKKFIFYRRSDDEYTGNIVYLYVE